MNGEDELEIRSATESYIDKLKTNGLNLSLEKQCEILMGDRQIIEFELDRYIGATEDSDSFIYKDKEMDEYGFKEVAEIVKKEFYENNCKGITNSDDQYIFNHDGELIENIDFLEAYAVAA